MSRPRAPRRAPPSPACPPRRPPVSPSRAPVAAPAPASRHGRAAGTPTCRARGRDRSPPRRGPPRSSSALAHIGAHLEPALYDDRVAHLERGGGVGGELPVGPHREEVGVAVGPGVLLAVPVPGGHRQPEARRRAVHQLPVHRLGRHVAHCADHRLVHRRPPLAPNARRARPAGCVCPAAAPSRSARPDCRPGDGARRALWTGDATVENLAARTGEPWKGTRTRKGPSADDGPVPPPERDRPRRNGNPALRTAAGVRRRPAPTAPRPVTRPYCSRTSRYRSSSAATGSSTLARPQPAAASRNRRSASCPYRRAGPGPPSGSSTR